MSELKVKVINNRLIKTECGRVYDLGSMAKFAVLPNGLHVFKKVGDVGFYAGTLNEPLGEEAWQTIYGDGAKK